MKSLLAQKMSCISPKVQLGFQPKTVPLSRMLPHGTDLTYGAVAGLWVGLVVVVTVVLSK